VKVSASFYHKEAARNLEEKFFLYMACDEEVKIKVFFVVLTLRHLKRFQKSKKWGIVCTAE